MIRDKSGQNTWRNEYYFDFQVENISPKQFGDFQLNCPAYAEEYLEQNYGADWAVVGSTQDLCHKTVGKMQAMDFHIKGSMFQPARPFY